MWCSDGLVDEFPATSIDQYTGLKDKNGVKIFEGDIVSYAIVKSCYTDEYKKAIKFKDGAFTHIGLCHNPVVIGNIHENPELIGESK
jgi:hypothetical protein